MSLNYNIKNSLKLVVIRRLKSKCYILMLKYLVYIVNKFILLFFY